MEPDRKTQTARRVNAAIGILLILAGLYLYETI